MTHGQGDSTWYGPARTDPGQGPGLRHQREGNLKGGTLPDARAVQAQGRRGPDPHRPEASEILVLL